MRHKLGRNLNVPDGIPVGTVDKRGLPLEDSDVLRVYRLTSVTITVRVRLQWRLGCTVLVGCMAVALLCGAGKLAIPSEVKVGVGRVEVAVVGVLPRVALDSQGA